MKIEVISNHKNLATHMLKCKFYTEESSFDFFISEKDYKKQINEGFFVKQLDEIQNEIPINYSYHFQYL